jgi:hypothetical protein
MRENQKPFLAAVRDWEAGTRPHRRRTVKGWLAAPDERVHASFDLVPRPRDPFPRAGLSGAHHRRTKNVRAVPGEVVPARLLIEVTGAVGRNRRMRFRRRLRVSPARLDARTGERRVQVHRGLEWGYPWESRPGAGPSRIVSNLEFSTPPPPLQNQPPPTPERQKCAVPPSRQSQPRRHCPGFCGYRRFEFLQDAEPSAFWQIPRL